MILGIFCGIMFFFHAILAVLNEYSLYFNFRIAVLVPEISFKWLSYTNPPHFILMLKKQTH